MARGGHGATTVASTMRIAALAGTGLRHRRPGGVDRGAQQSFDVSADLTELSTTDVAVVSAGVKSILDIGLTLETLETLGVPVLAVGTHDFPSFYSRSSGHRAPMRVDEPKEGGRDHARKWDGLSGGVVVANPIPARDEIPAERIGGIIDQALADMDARGIHGKDATPYLLGRYSVEITGGESLEANIALVRNNARFGAAVATAYAAG